MAVLVSVREALTESTRVRRWISRAFVVSILVYLVVIGYLLAESVRGASKWAPYGVNMPVFVTLIVASEVVITLTAIWIFREDAGIWPASVADGWRTFRGGARIRGLGAMLVGAWDVSIIDLRLRTSRAIALGRANRLAALAPLAYALIASARGAPWGLRSSALVDVAITLVVWAFMEVVMVQPGRATAPSGPSQNSSVVPVVGEGMPAARAQKESRYEVRRVRHADISRIQEIERIKWGGEAASRELIESRLAVYPQGQLAAIHETVVGGAVVRTSLVAWITVMAADEARVRSFDSWDEVTSNGTIRSCDPRGNVLVGVNLTSVTQGATYLLLGEVLASVVDWGKAKMMGGGRLNGFVAFNARRAAEGLEVLGRTAASTDDDEVNPAVPTKQVQRCRDLIGGGDTLNSDGRQDGFDVRGASLQYGENVAKGCTIGRGDDPDPHRILRHRTLAPLVEQALR